MPYFYFALFLFLAKSDELDVKTRELEGHIEEGRKKSERDITEAKRNRRNSRQRAVKLRANAVAKYQSKLTEKNAVLLVAIEELVKSNEALAEASSANKVNARAAALSAEAAAAATEKLAEQRLQNKKLREEVLAKENEVVVLEEKLADASGKGDQAAADDYVLDGSDRKVGKPRQHTHKTRLAILKALALGIPPSKVVSALTIHSSFDFEGRSPPKVDFCRMMRRELMIVVAAVAAATAANPNYTWSMLTSDATSIEGKPLVNVTLRLMKKEGGKEAPVGPTETAIAPESVVVPNKRSSKSSKTLTG